MGGIWVKLRSIGIVGSHGNILKIVMMVIQHCESTKTTELYIAKLKNFMLCEF